MLMIVVIFIVSFHNFQKTVHCSVVFFAHVVSLRNVDMVDFTPFYCHLIAKHTFYNKDLSRECHMASRAAVHVSIHICCKGSIIMLHELIFTFSFHFCMVLLYLFIVPKLTQACLSISIHTV